MRNKVAWWSLGAVTALALIVVAAAIYGKSRLEGIARSYGIPTSGDEFNAMGRVPPADNAYGLYLVFKETRTGERAALGKRMLTMPPLGDMMDETAGPFEPAKAKAYLDHFPRTLAAAGALASRSKWFVERDMSNPRAAHFPELGGLKDAVKLLVLDAQLKIHNGDRRGALDQYGRAAKVATFANSESTIIGVLVYLANEQTVLRSLASELPKIAGDRVAERRTISIIGSMEKPDLARGMKGEGYFLYYLVKNGLPLDFFGEPGEGASDEEASRIKLINNTRGFWGPDVLRREGEVVQSAQGNDYSRFIHQTAEVEKWMLTTGMSQWVARTVFPIFVRAGQACKQLKVVRDLVRAALPAIASERTPNVKGTTDPFSGRPYKLVLQPHGWRLYSVGADRHDDGGVINPKRPYESPDIILSYNGQAFLVGH